MFPSNDPPLPFSDLSIGPSAISPSNASPRTVTLRGIRPFASEQRQNFQQVTNVANRLAQDLFYDSAYDVHSFYSRRRVATMGESEFNQTAEIDSAKAPSVCPQNIVKQEIEKIINQLQQWATDRSISPEVQRARIAVYKQLSGQLNTWLHPRNMGKIALTGNVFPIFILQEIFIQDNLKKLSLDDDLLELGVFEWQEMKNLRNLETLVIEDKRVRQIPESIEALRQLSRIEIVNTKIICLPESIGNLTHLNSLILEDNKKLIRLPRSLVRLRNLRTLSLRGCIALQNLPDSSPNPFHTWDTSYKFGNLRALESLSLKDCSALKKIPQSICELSALKVLNLSGCAELENLPECMDALQTLDILRFEGTKVKSLPNSLYRLAFIKPSGFLPSPWNDTVQWMRQAIRSSARRYTVTGDSFRIEIKPDTAIPFAQDHLRLLVNTLESNGRLANPPTTLSVVYPEEDPIDAGGLRRDRFYHIFPDYAQQIKENADPILVYREEKNCFILERAINRKMTSLEIEFCQNAGKLMSALLLGFASFPNSRGDACKIGNVFPEHFYAGLLHVAFYLPYHSFERMSRKDQESLCRILAINDKNGLSDETGKLLFDITSLKENFSNIISDEDLYKIWKLMNHYEEVEDVDDSEDEWPTIVKSMREAGFIKEEFEAYQTFPEGMLEKFRNMLNTDTNIEIQSILTGYMFAQYHRQCEPLVYVAQGFRSVLNSFPPNTDFQALVYQHLINANEAMGLRNIPWTTMLSNVIQGPSFTFDAFRLLMQRCAFNEDTPQIMQEAVCARMHVLIDWYLNEATDDQRKKMLRCMNGTDVIITDMRPLKFGGPTRPGPCSIFHTCFGSVDLGNALMSLDPITQKEPFIQMWLEHIDLALGGGISIR